MFQYLRPRSVAISALVAAVASILVGSALAANIAGTPKNDTLRGTAKADRILGQGGNDKLYGLGGNDVLNGGPGNDVLTGGAGADNLTCGPGRDTALADAQDKLSADCETIKGLPKPRPLRRGPGERRGEQRHDGRAVLRLPRQGEPAEGDGRVRDA